MLLNILFLLILSVWCESHEKVFKKKEHDAVNIAIIGSGAGGSSAAYYLNEKSALGGVKLNIDLFEKENRVGGRAYSWTSDELKEKFEMGAGVFVDVNHNIMDALKTFNISYKRTSRGGGDIGLYSGTEFISILDSSLFNKLSFYYRYGFGLYQSTRFAKTVKTKFLELYKPNFGTFESMEELFERLGLLELVTRTTDEVLEEWYIGEEFRNEMLQAITRNIYTINNKLHSLAGAIALIGVDGSYTTEKGNNEIFKNFILYSNAQLHLNSKITKIKQTASGYQLDVNGVALNKKYNYIILATPLAQSQIQFYGVDIPDHNVPYQPVHEMVLRDTQLNPSFFGKDKVPSLIFGYNETLPFTVLSQSQNPNFVTISAKEELKDAYLSQLLTTIPSKDKIVYKKWLAYPKMVTLSERVGGKFFPPIKLAKNLYYVNAMEPAISCMETETISAKNIINLILKDLSKQKK